VPQAAPGHISKQGNRMMRWLLVEAAYVAVRKDAGIETDLPALWRFVAAERSLAWRCLESWP